MTVYMRPNADDENDGSENAPVKSPKRAIEIANRNNDQEINLLTADWTRINRELGRARRMSSHRATDRPWITPPSRSKTLALGLPSSSIDVVVVGGLSSDIETICV
jgi:hypothetical protein